MTYHMSTIGHYSTILGHSRYKEKVKKPLMIKF